MTETANPIDDLDNAAAGMHGFDANTQNRPPQMSGGGIVLVIEDAARKTQLVVDDADAHALWIRSWRTDESRWRRWKLFSSMRQINKTITARIADALETAINGEVEDRRAAIVAAMEQEAAARQTAIDAAVSGLQSGITKDAARQMIEDRVDIESDTRNDAINTAVNALATGRQSLIDAAVGVERAARESALADAARQRDDAIATAIVAEANDRDNAIATAISGEVQQRTSAIAVETAARNSAISEALAGEARKRTNSITAAVAAETDRRTADIEQFDRRVTASVAAVASGVRQDIEGLSQRHSADIASMRGLVAAAAAEVEKNSIGVRELKIAEPTSPNQCITSNSDGALTWEARVNPSPIMIRNFTTNESIVLPVGSKAMLIEASGGGGGGGARTFINQRGEDGTKGGDTTVILENSPINMLAKGGQAGSASINRPGANIVSGSRGGDVYDGGGASGGKGNTHYRWDDDFYSGGDGGPASCVTKYWRHNDLGGKRITVRIGHGGSGGAGRASPGIGGYVRLWVW